MGLLSTGELDWLRQELQVTMYSAADERSREPGGTQRRHDGSPVPLLLCSMLAQVGVGIAILSCVVLVE